MNYSSDTAEKEMARLKPHMGGGGESVQKSLQKCVMTSFFHVMIQLNK